MFWAITVIFLIMTILLLSGKGAFLIAGYNTSSPTEKLKYDEKKLCLVMGSGMGVITAFLFVLSCFGYDAPKWIYIALPFVIGAVTVGMLVLCNTICKSKNIPDTVAEVSVDQSKTNRRTFVGVIVFVAIVFAIVGITLFTGEIKTTVDENNVKIDGTYWSDYSVSLDSITNVSYAENIEVGKRTNGMGSYKLSEGNFRNDEYGDYILYAYANCDSYVVLKTNSKTVVLNAKTSQETEQLFEQIENAISK